MKNDLLKLVEQADDIYPLFHLKGGNGFPIVEVISDNPDFMKWKGRVQFELQSIYDCTKDNFIWDTLVILKQDFNGWHDKRSFIDLHGKLLAIKENIDTFYPNTTKLLQSDEKANDVSNANQSNSLNNGGSRISLKEILGDIIQSDNPTQAVCNKFENATSNEKTEIKGILKELEQLGHIKVLRADNTIYLVNVLGSARPYYEQLIDMEEDNMIQKETKVFISHSSKDKAYAEALVELLEYIGLDQSNLFCSSTSGYGIPLGKDIYEYLKEQFNTYNLHIIFLLSINYYESVACLNEMGAAWVLHNSYTTILIPGFTFEQIKGAVNPNQISLKLDGDIYDVKEKLDELKKNLQQNFNLNSKPDSRWNKKRDDFISAVLNISKTQSHNVIALSEGALNLLNEAAIAGTNGEILVQKNLYGTTIQVNKKTIFSSFQQQEIWEDYEDYINELLTNKLIGTKADVEGFRSFYVTQSGLQYIDDHEK